MLPQSHFKACNYKIQTFLSHVERLYPVESTVYVYQLHTLISRSRIGWQQDPSPECTYIL